MVVAEQQTQFGKALTASQVDTVGKSYRNVQTSSLWQHERVLTGWDQYYDQLSKGKFNGRVTEAWIGDVQIFNEHASQAVFQVGPGRSSIIALGVFVHLPGEARWRGNAIGMDHVTALSDHATLELATPPNSCQLGVSVPISMIPIYGEGQSYLDSNALIAGAAHQVHNSNLAAMLRQRLNLALLTMTYQPYRLALAEARNQLISELVSFIDEYLHLATATRNESAPTKARHVVMIARKYIEENPDRPVTVLDLCKRTFTSRRTLQYCFTQVIGMSPAAYLKVVRLNGLHRNLMNSRGEKTIGDIAACWGFWHLSQLSVDYRQMFGELPSATLKRAAGHPWSS